MEHTFSGQTVTVRFNDSKCSHAGECVKGLPAVFNPANNPWIDPDRASSAQLMEVVRRCPSGALTAEMAKPLNGINVPALGQFADTVRIDPAEGVVGFSVTTEWQGGTRSVSRPGQIALGEQQIQRAFEIAADEPNELLGTNTAANPQELLLAAMNACMTVGYVANAAALGITVKKLSIAARGQLDLRGFLGLDAAVNPGYDEVHYDVRIESDASDEMLAVLHRAVQATSPNFHNMARAIKMSATINGRA